MSSSVIEPFGSASFSLAVSDKIAVFSTGAFKVYKTNSYTNAPAVDELVTDKPAGSLQYQSAAVSAASTYRVEAYGGAPVYVEVGAAADVKYPRLIAPVQVDPVAVNATGAVSAAAILGGIVTSSTAAAVAGTIPTGTVMDAAADFAIGDSIDWSVINTGPNAFTVTAAADHTIVGAAAVATVTSGRFRTRKTAANTFITYRLS